MTFGQKIALAEGNLLYFPGFLSESEATTYFEDFKTSIGFEQHEVTIFGKTHKTPRLESFHAKENRSYSYSGNKLASKPFTEALNLLCERIEKATNSEFNCVLINLYRDGSDSNGWHADNEKELGPNPEIASLSLGATRRFDLKHNETPEKISMELHAGDLLWMDNQIQNFYKHQIAKTIRVLEPRINLTFRLIE
jgi:alkylated DNA repair dioxygenase AlkB